MQVFTIGHGTRPSEELAKCLLAGKVSTLVDVRRFPSSRRNPQFNQPALIELLNGIEITYRHAEELGGRRTGEPGESRFACLRVAAFRSYAVRMSRPDWQRALDDALEEPVPCFLCAETSWQRCHRRLIADLLTARGHQVVHLIRPHERELHRLWDVAEARAGRLYYCGNLAA
jgi:uncharacterized protein (DUF488 family)